MTELDKVLAEIGQLQFDGKQFDNGCISVELAGVGPQVNGLMVRLNGRYWPSSFGTPGCPRLYAASNTVLLKPGEERLKLLRELAATWEEARIREKNATIVIGKPKSREATKPGRLRRDEVTQPVSPSIEQFVDKVFGHRVNAEDLKYARSLRMIWQTFEQIPADISLDEVVRIYNEVLVKRVQEK
jgi:hypothetical protein